VSSSTWFNYYLRFSKDTFTSSCNFNNSSLSFFTVMTESTKSYQTVTLHYIIILIVLYRLVPIQCCYIELKHSHQVQWTVHVPLNVQLLSVGMMCCGCNITVTRFTKKHYRVCYQLSTYLVYINRKRCTKI